MIKQQPLKWEAKHLEQMRNELIADLPPLLRLIAEGGGLELAIKVATKYGGGYVYIANLLAPAKATREKRYAHIRDEYNKGGTTVTALTRKYKLTRRRIYQIIAGTR